MCLYLWFCRTDLLNFSFFSFFFWGGHNCANSIQNTSAIIGTDSAQCNVGIDGTIYSTCQCSNIPLTDLGSGCKISGYVYDPSVQGTTFSPFYPASSAYVTSVSSTQLNPQNATQEIMTGGFAGGGGFFRLYPKAFLSRYVSELHG